MERLPTDPRSGIRCHLGRFLLPIEELGPGPRQGLRVMPATPAEARMLCPSARTGAKTVSMQASVMTATNVIAVRLRIRTRV